MFEITEIFCEELRYSIAVFPSKEWGACAQHMHFEDGSLSGRDRDFPNDTFIDIHEWQFVFDIAKAPHLAIAVANPHDRESWRAAQAACALVKSKGAVTLLFAAHPYPEFRYPFDPRILIYKPEDEPLDGADTVINFVTRNLREEFLHIVYAMTVWDKPGLPGNDFSDFQLESRKRAVYIRDSARGAPRVAKATRFACEQLERPPLAHHHFVGGLVFIETDQWTLQEWWDVHDIFSNALPNRDFAFRVAKNDGVDPWLTVHAIMTYDAM